MTATRSFTVRGSRNGSQVNISWTGGKLGGDPPTVDLVTVEAELAKLHPGDHQSWSHITDADGTLAHDPLADPTSAWRLIRSVVDTISTVEGDAPESALAEAGRPAQRR